MTVGIEHEMNIENDEDIWEEKLKKEEEPEEGIDIELMEVENIFHLS